MANRIGAVTGSYPKAETLSEQLTAAAAPAGAFAEEQKVDGQKVTLAVSKR